MKYSNCFIFAVSKWVTKGGWLAMRRSLAGPYPHFVHIEDLPEDTPAKHFVAKNNPWFMTPIFEGKVLDTVGNVKPPKVSGLFDFVLLFFWLVYFIGIFFFFYGIFTWVFAS